MVVVEGIDEGVIVNEVNVVVVDVFVLNGVIYVID